MTLFGKKAFPGFGDKILPSCLPDVFTLATLKALLLLQKCNFTRDRKVILNFYALLLFLRRSNRIHSVTKCSLLSCAPLISFGIKKLVYFTVSRLPFWLLQNKGLSFLFLPLALLSSPSSHFQRINAWETTSTLATSKQRLWPKIKPN